MYIYIYIYIYIYKLDAVSKCLRVLGIREAVGCSVPSEARALLRASRVPKTRRHFDTASH